MSESEELSWYREVEFRRITRQLDTLYAAVAAGERRDYTRQRIERLEALQAALCGFPEQLSG